MAWRIVEIDEKEVAFDSDFSDEEMGVIVVLAGISMIAEPDDSLGGRISNKIVWVAEKITDNIKVQVAKENAENNKN
jgi:hypothetical protein